MQLIGVEFLNSLLSQVGYSAKIVFNQQGAIFFPVDQEHRWQKAEGISYEDDYAGNALAAMLAPGRVEVRFHRDFNDAQVAHILSGLLADPRLEAMRDWQVLYQGRALVVD